MLVLQLVFKPFQRLQLLRSDCPQPCWKPHMCCLGSEVQNGEPRAHPDVSGSMQHGLLLGPTVIPLRFCRQRLRAMFLPLSSLCSSKIAQCRSVSTISAVCFVLQCKILKPGSCLPGLPGACRLVSSVYTFFLGINMLLRLYHS